MIPTSVLLPTVGGCVLALSTSLNLGLFGRITGMSGILNQAFVGSGDDRQWRFSILAGLVAGGWVVQILNPSWVGPFTTNVPFTISAGILVGFGSMLSNGCTSGHGLCGLPRFSVRSLVAIVTFMASGAFSSIIRTRIFSSDNFSSEVSTLPYPTILTAGLVLGLFLTSLKIKRDLTKKENSKVIPEPTFDTILTFVIGVIFSVGLGISGMCMPHKVTGFLNFLDNWDPALIFVMGSGVTLNALFFNYITKARAPLMRPKFSIPVNKDINARLLIGSTCFGLGWGLAGLCPGPGIAGLASGSIAAYTYLLGVLGGMKVAVVLDGIGIIPK